LLRARGATFNTVGREARANDIVVVDYEGKVDDKPISEVAPANRGLATQKDFWVEIRPGTFIPGFAEQLEGLAAGARKTVTVDFPADFVSQPLAGKKGVYEVEVKEVKERVLPELNDEFAKSWEAQDVKGLREGVRQDLQNELNDKIRRTIREQAVRALLDPLNFDLPESAVLAETRNVVYELVKENQDRGISKDVIEKNKDEIYSLASNAARSRVKGAFVFAKIAEKEGIKVEAQEFHSRVFAMAKAMKMTPEKLMEELQKRDSTGHVAEQILNEKVIDLLQENAKIEDVPAAAPDQA
jgi:trigger factor